MPENIRGAEEEYGTREPVVCSEGVGEVIWIEGGPMDEIGLANESPLETRGVLPI